MIHLVLIALLCSCNVYFGPVFWGGVGKGLTDLPSCQNFLIESYIKLFLTYYQAHSVFRDVAKENLSHQPALLDSFSLKYLCSVQISDAGIC